MPENTYEKVISALQQNKLDFDVSMQPVSFLGQDGEFHKTKMFTPVRNDNGTIVSEHTFTRAYKPIQNRDAFKVISDIAAEADIEFRNVGSWGNGAGVFAQISIGDDIVVGDSNDRVGRYLSVVNAHDGSRGCSILITPYRFFCRNQISPAINHAEKNSLFSVKHNSLAESRLRILGETIRICNGVFNNSAEAYRKLAAKRIDMDYVREGIFRSLPFESMEDNPGVPTPHFTHTLEQMVNRFEHADGGQVEKFTAWNLYNAIQGTFQHDSRSSVRKAYSVLCGQIAQRSRTALTKIIELSNTGLVKTSTPEFDKAFAEAA